MTNYPEMLRAIADEYERRSVNLPIYALSELRGDLNALSNEVLQEIQRLKIVPMDQ